MSADTPVVGDPLKESVAPVTARRLQAKIAQAQVEGRMPSIAAGVVRDGNLVWAGGHGDLAGTAEDTQYKIGSITKTFTAVLILQLVEEGVLSLDDTVSTVLGEIGYGNRTIRSLLAHNSGMQAEPNGSWWERSPGLTFDELAAANADSAGVLPIGQQFHYTNLAYGLLGETVARLRDLSWWECVQSRILVPLGMNRTTYQCEGVHAQGTSVDPYTGELIEEPHPDTGAMAPAGQMWSTVADLATYCTFLVEGHAGILPKARLEEAYIPQSGALASGLESAHGLGFQMHRGGSGVLVGHTGSMPGFVASCFIDRLRRTGVVAFANAMTGLPAAGIATTLLEELEASEPTVPEPWRPSTSVPDVVREIVGVWHWGPTPMVFGWEGDQLVVRRNGVVGYRYRLDGDRLVGTAGYQTGETLQVVRNDDGSINHLNLSTFIFTRTPYDPAAPIPGGVPQR
ncbi:beta-lactamase family protein [Nocardioides sp. JQ2195]|uniref:serine hydrolase domain-containing protein n=1 Tax=Nocardioides sp. JQ2195 TaxID=2592334 RepID=UPI00143EF437|nr:serine hydrolase domain-containing protein [Nocardioides sp. JQ2195]QIX26845.1 beta-lactamase family protein [Nocardioides sp. JQ2195]